MEEEEWSLEEEQQEKRRENEEPPKGWRVQEFLWGILFLVIWFVFVVFGLTGFFLGEIFSQRLGRDTLWIVTGKLTGTPFILGIVLAVVVIWLFAPLGLLPDVVTGEEGLKANLPGNIKGLIVVAVFFLTLFGSYLSSLWYEKYTPDGVEIHHCLKRKTYHYSAEEIESFAVKSDFHGVLMIELRMRDGRKTAFNGGFWNAVEYTSDAWDALYPDGIYDYGPVWAGEMARRGIRMDDSEWEEEIEKELKDTSWEELAGEMREAYYREAE